MPKTKTRAGDVLYACPHCHRTFKTKAQAMDCAKPIPDLKKGDLVRIGHKIWVMRDMPDDTGYGSIERSTDYLKVMGFSLSYQSRAWATPALYNCGGSGGDNRVQKVPISEIEKQLKHRRAQVRAGERLVAYMKEQEGGKS